MSVGLVIGEWLREEEEEVWTFTSFVGGGRWVIKIKVESPLVDQSDWGNEVATKYPVNGVEIIKFGGSTNSYQKPPVK